MARLNERAAARRRAAEVRALLLLDALPRVGPATIRRLVDVFGSAEAALAAPDRAFEVVVGVEARRARGDREAEARVDRALEMAERLEMRVVLRGEEDYPRPLLNIVDPPELLFLRGRVELLGAEGVAIVGARRSTARGKDVAHRLGRALAAVGVPVVSGMARGVDGAAHRGALDGGGTTVAVMGSGAERAYPSSHARLFRAVLERGLVVSEFAPGTEPLPYNFPRRNRVLAALSRAVVVVEAGRRSGALITVDHALDLGLDVYAVPGPIDAPSCEGSNRLLQDGARPIVSVSSFVREIEGASGEGERIRPERPEGDAGRVLELLEEGAAHADDVARHLDLDVGSTLALLAKLELRGWVEQAPGMRFRRAG